MDRGRLPGGRGTTRGTAIAMVVLTTLSVLFVLIALVRALLGA
ncbi:hypothetical protein [Streptomyces sp. ODS28]